MERRPGGALAKRPLHFIWILDVSGSMKFNGKIEALNFAIRETLPDLRHAAAQNPNIDVLMRAVTFGDDVRWHLAEPTPAGRLIWQDVRAGGHSAMGGALAAVAAELRTPPMPERAVSPVLILVSDGDYTDDFDSGLKALLSEPWGRDAHRIAVAIGNDMPESLDALRRFIADDELEPLHADNRATLIEQIRWAALTGVQSVSQVHDRASRTRLHQAHVRSSPRGGEAEIW